TLNQRELSADYVRTKLEVVSGLRPRYRAAVLESVVELQKRYERGVAEALELLDHQSRETKRLNVSGIDATDRIARKTKIVGRILAIVHRLRLNRCAPKTALQFDQQIRTHRVHEVELKILRSSLVRSCEAELASGIHVVHIGKAGGLHSCDVVQRVSSEEVPFRRKQMIDSSIQCRSILRPHRRRSKVGDVDSRRVWQRIHCRDLLRDRIEQAVVWRHIQSVEWDRARGRAAKRIRNRELVRRIRADAAGIEARRAVLGEISDALLCRRNHGCDRNALPDFQSLIIGKEKRFVLDDRAAETASELILAELLFGQLFPSCDVVVAVGVEPIVAKEFKQ